MARIAAARGAYICFRSDLVELRCLCTLRQWWARVFLFSFFFQINKLAVKVQSTILSTYHIPNFSFLFVFHLFSLIRPKFFVYCSFYIFPGSPMPHWGFKGLRRYFPPFLYLFSFKTPQHIFLSFPEFSPTSSLFPLNFLPSLFLMRSYLCFPFPQFLFSSPTYFYFFSGQLSLFYPSFPSASPLIFVLNQG